MNKVEFYFAIHHAVVWVRNEIKTISFEREPTPADYTCLSIEAYNKMRFGLYPILSDDGGILSAIYNLSFCAIRDPEALPTLAACYMEESWEFYEDQLNGKKYTRTFIWVEKR